MRLVIFGLALALAMPAAAGIPGLSLAAAQSPVSTQPLAAGEVLLETNAMGSVTTRADLATLTIPIDATGATDAAARRQAESAADRIAAAAASAGVSASDITRRPITTGDGAAMAMAMADMARTAQQSAYARRGATPILPETPGQPSANAHGEIEIRLRDLARLPQLRSALEAAGAAAVPEPIYTLSDDRAARSEARAQAIAQARANAESYASALGMRVLRIVRVTERVGVDLLGTMFTEGTRMRRMMSGIEGRSPEINTAVALGMDFAMAPR